MSFCYQSNNLVDSHQVWFIKGSFHIWELELLKPLGLRLAVTLFYFSLPPFFWDIYLHSIGLLSVKSALAMTFFFSTCWSECHHRVQKQADRSTRHSHEIGNRTYSLRCFKCVNLPNFTTGFVKKCAIMLDSFSSGHPKIP